MSLSRTYTLRLSSAGLNGLRKTCGYATSFAPLVVMTVEDGTTHIGKQFTVTFSRHEGPLLGCSPSTTETYEVQANGAVAPSDGTPAVLIDTPRAQTGNCVYSVAYPTHEDGSGRTLVRASSPTADTTTSATSDAALATSVTYRARTS